MTLTLKFLMTFKCIRKKIFLFSSFWNLVCVNIVLILIFDYLTENLLVQIKDASTSGGGETKGDEKYYPFFQGKGLYLLRRGDGGHLECLNIPFFQRRILKLMIMMCQWRYLMKTQMV